MQPAFIISEYNPFHNGHQYHIAKTVQQTSADVIVAVMSGNFVQRGDIAICDKFLRAEMAVRGGADLVVELPLKYAIANASRFASGAVQTIAAFGLAGFVSFGASADLPALIHANEITSDAALRQETDDLSRIKGKTYPASLDMALRARGEADVADLLNDPNNVLALEYLKSLASSQDLRPVAIERNTAYGHNAQDLCEGFASGSLIRSMFYDREQSITAQEALPESTASMITDAAACGHFPVNRVKYKVAQYSRLLSMTTDDFARLDNVSHGLENRIVQAIKQHADPDDAIAEIKSKRYTMSRLRQIFTAATIGVTREDMSTPPSYLRVLAFNDTGRRLLADIRETARIPIVTNLSDVANEPLCTRDVSLDYLADKLLDLCLPEPKCGNRSFLDHPVYIKKSAEA